jgi:hypothetical protein
MKKKIIGGIVAIGLIVSAGIAWAAIVGFVNVPDVVQGIASGTGSTSCQLTAITFDIPEPEWNVSLADYGVSTVDYGGISQTCQNLGTADLLLTVTDNNNVIATGSALNMSSASGTITLSSPVIFDTAANADYNFLVRNQ